MYCVVEFTLHSRCSTRELDGKWKGKHICIHKNVTLNYFYAYFFIDTMEQSVESSPTINTANNIPIETAESGTTASECVPEVLSQTGETGATQSTAFTLVPTMEWNNIENELKALKAQNNMIVGKKFRYPCFKKSKFLISNFFAQAKIIL